MHAPRRRRREGFTLIEVMVAVAILMLGALGIVALQTATTRGNISSRELTTANEIARTWLDRYRRDALRWTTNQQGQPGSVANTDLLSGTPNAGEEAAWSIPPIDAYGTCATTPVAGCESYAFDYFGREVRADAAYYCVHARTEFLVPQDTIRVEVRVWWYRNIGGGETRVNRTLYPNCGVGQEAVIDAAINGGDGRAAHVKAVHASTIVRWTPLLVPVE